MVGSNIVIILLYLLGAQNTQPNSSGFTNQTFTNTSNDQFPNTSNFVQPQSANFVIKEEYIDEDFNRIEVVNFVAGPQFIDAENAIQSDTANSTSLLTRAKKRKLNDEQIDADNQDQGESISKPKVNNKKVQNKIVRVEDKEMACYVAASSYYKTDSLCCLRDTCLGMFSTNKDLEHHLLSEHNSLSYSCPVSECKESFHNS